MLYYIEKFEHIVVAFVFVRANAGREPGVSKRIEPGLSGESAETR